MRSPLTVATTCCLAVGMIALLVAPAAPDARRRRSPATSPAPADSAVYESPPGKLIVPPRTPSGAEQSPADTARAAAHRKALEAFGRGLALERDGAYAAAIISYTNAARMDPTLRGPSLRVGKLFAWKQQYDPAARAFREEMHRDPDNPEPVTQYALMLAEMGDTARPVPMLQELTQRAPGNAAVWRALGFVYARLGRHDAAERALRGSIALNGKDPQAWRDLGVVLAARGEEPGAREAYRHALAVDPHEVSTLVNLGNLEARAGDHAHALAHYAQAEREDSTLADAYRGQVRELVALGREPGAGAVWRRWLVSAPDDHEVREGAARHFVRQGRVDVALEIARDGVRRSPSSGEARWLLGEMQAEAEDPLAALTAYRDAAARFREPADRARAEAGIARLRASAPDSLRARFTADSVTAARADTTRASMRR
jgi:tetratricopeptide (TPR) repeat protein